ncbi:MAG: phosphatase PAP2 family protein [bacterium]
MRNSTQENQINQPKKFSFSITRWLISAGTWAIGIILSVVVAGFTSTHWGNLPSINDLILDRLPYYDLYFIGEMIFWVFLAILFFLLWRNKQVDFNYIIFVIGLFYIIRPIFLLFMPIGHPIDAPLFEDRFHLYPPYAYFPSGHVGLTTIMVLFLPTQKMRLWFFIVLIIFSIGMLVTRAHYTADVIGGMVIAYALFVFCDRNIRAYWEKKAVLKQSQ